MLVITLLKSVTPNNAIFSRKTITLNGALLLQFLLERQDAADEALRHHHHHDAFCCRERWRGRLFKLHLAHALSDKGMTWKKSILINFDAGGTLPSRSHCIWPLLLPAYLPIAAHTQTDPLCLSFFQFSITSTRDVPCVLMEDRAISHLAEQVTGISRGMSKCAAWIRECFPGMTRACSFPRVEGVWKLRG